MAFTAPREPGRCPLPLLPLFSVLSFLVKLLPWLSVSWNLQIQDGAPWRDSLGTVQHDSQARILACGTSRGNHAAISWYWTILSMSLGGPQGEPTVFGLRHSKPHFTTWIIVNVCGSGVLTLKGEGWTPLSLKSFPLLLCFRSRLPHSHCLKRGVFSIPSLSASPCLQQEGVWSRARD